MKTKIDAAKLEQILRKFPVDLTPQSAFVRVESKNGLRMYVSSKSLVSVVHLSGFVYPSGPGILEIAEDKRPTQQVKQEIDFEKPEEEILETFEAVVEYMVEQPQRTKEARGQASKKNDAQGWSIKAPPKASQEATVQAIEEAAKDAAEETVEQAALEAASA